MTATVMGIVNMTPDSFSDGGQIVDVDAAVARARAMVADGAAYIDVGGESTRPGAEVVSVATELSRVIPVVEAVSAAVGDHAEISIDTTKPEVARAAVAAGATIINDVSARLDDVAAELGVAWIAMHRPAPSATMQNSPQYKDVVTEVAAYLAEAAERAKGRGVERLWIDPGVGFGKTIDHNLDLIANLDRLTALGHPVMIGASRKATVGELHARSDKADSSSMNDRLEGSVTIAAWSAYLGADVVRVHDVRATVQAVQVVG